MSRRTPRGVTVASGPVDRSEASRALAKALAYAACGKQGEAEAWARTLVELLHCGGILRP